MKRETTLIASILAAITASLCCLGPIAAVVLGLGSFGAAAVFETWRPYLLGVTFGLLALGFYFTYRRPEARCAEGSVCATHPSVSRSRKIWLWLVTVLVVAFAAFPYYSGAVWSVLSPRREALGETGSVQAGSPSSDARHDSGAVGGAQRESAESSPSLRAPQAPQETSRSRAAAQDRVPAAVRGISEASALKRAVMEVRGMSCAGCAVTVAQALRQLPGVKSAEVSHEDGRAIIAYDPTRVSLQQLKEAIERTGFQVGVVRTVHP